MTRFTRSAVDYLTQAGASSGGARRSPRLRSAHGKVELTFTDTPVFDDERVDAGGVTVLIESAMVPRLGHATIDATHGGRDDLVILDP